MRANRSTIAAVLAVTGVPAAVAGSADGAPRARNGAELTPAQQCVKGCDVFNLKDGTTFTTRDGKAGFLLTSGTPIPDTR